ncbi:MAG: nucleotidyl transferase AbiEii/AbiGii toxin family protein [Acidobacteria bacterium]|nr:nucleotidyl transferase AbiEii/AbiGii toxin family protein [Acidobacteriota bacterium]
MKEHLRRLASAAGNDLARTCLVREYLQARILEALQDTGAFLRWAFLGGTALRFLFSIPRFSEDLDFSLIDPEKNAGFGSAAAGIKRLFEREGYSIDVRASEKRTVSSAWIRFPGLPHEIGISPHAARVLSVKLELHTNPPAGAHIVNTVVRRHVTLNLCHHDLSSLLAGKIHAVLSRQWTKGRDLYDLVWYLADRACPVPNLDLLNAALAQTGWKGPRITEADWREQLSSRIKSRDWEKARADVKPFLERARDLDLLTKEVLLSLLK